MKMSTVREFRDHATVLLRSKDPVPVTRRGHLAGVFFPRPETTLPIELKRELFRVLSAEVRRQIERRGLPRRGNPGGFRIVAEGASCNWPPTLMYSSPQCWAVAPN